MSNNMATVICAFFAAVVLLGISVIIGYNSVEKRENKANIVNNCIEQGNSAILDGYGDLTACIKGEPVGN